MARLLIVPLGFAVFIASLLAAPVPKDADKPTVYFMTRVGDTRVSTWVGRDHEVTETVTKVEEEDGTKLVTVELTSERGFQATDLYALNEKGLFRLAHNDHYYKKEWCVLKAPYRAGTKWEVDVVDHLGSEVKSAQATSKAEWVEVPAGKFLALRVDIAYGGEQKSRTATAWFAPGIGQVKLVYRHGDGKEAGVVVLKSFTPGK